MAARRKFPAIDPRLKKLEQQNTWMWVMTTSLLPALGVAIAALYFSRHIGLPTEIFPVESTGGTLVTSLIGLLLIFALYIAFKQRELRGLRTNLVGEQIEREALRSRLAELTALFEMAMQANSKPELSLFLGTVSQRMLTALDSQGSCILLYNHKAQEFRCEVGAGPDIPYPKGTSVGMSGTMAGWVAESKEPLTIGSREIKDRFAREAEAYPGFGAVMCVPLQVAGELIGVLVIHRDDEDNPYSPLDTSVVMALVDHIALAVRRIDEFAQLTQRAKRLEEANRRLAELNRFKRVAISTINHEIRTPLAAILSHADLWLRDRDALPEEKQVELIETVYDQGSRLSDFVVEISDLLALELGSQTLNLTSVSINHIVSENVLTLSPRASQKKVIIDTRLEEGLKDVNLDAEKLRRSFRYLISNSVRFAREGGKIQISTNAATDERGREVIQIGILDDGLGSGSRDLGSIIPDTNSNPDQYGHRLEALGLGFFLVREVVGLHGGKVWTEKKEEQTGFWFSLPADSIHTQVDETSKEDLPRAA